MNRVSLRIRILLITAVITLFVTTCTAGLANTVKSPEIKSNVLRFQGADGKVKSLTITECTDPVMSGDVQVGTKFCLCQGVAFRVAQLMAREWSDGAFHVDDVKVVTGWKTDGPAELFVEKLGMTSGDQGSFNYDDDARIGKDQYIEDAWYKVTILSTGKTSTFNATDLIYEPNPASGDFLTYRREVKGGNITHKVEMQALKGKIVQNLKATPFAASSFWITKGKSLSTLDDIAYSNELEYMKTDGSVDKIDITECTDPVMSGDVQMGTKFCLCEGVAFRISQTMRNVWDDGTFHVDDVRVATSWNTDGPHEFFEERLGVSGDDIIICGHNDKGQLNESVPPKPGKDLTLADSRYEITVKSTGEIFTFSGTGRLYTGKFLDYRSEVKNKDMSHKKEMGQLRKQVESNLKAIPFTGMLETSETSRSDSDSGGCNTVAFVPAALFLPLPLLLLKRDSH